MEAKIGELVRNKNSESGELGVLMGWKRYKNYETGERFILAEVYWPERRKAGTIQEALIEGLDESR
tara:strand:+ start:446 stop:643 length:198 start_codon:yes stop_codon:yes gene_type:complete